MPHSLVDSLIQQAHLGGGEIHDDLYGNYRCSSRSQSLGRKPDTFGNPQDFDAAGCGYGFYHQAKLNPTQFLETSGKTNEFVPVRQKASQFLDTRQILDIKLDGKGRHRSSLESDPDVDPVTGPTGPDGGPTTDPTAEKELAQAEVAAQSDANVAAATAVTDPNAPIDPATGLPSGPDDLPTPPAAPPPTVLSLGNFIGLATLATVFTGIGFGLHSLINPQHSNPIVDQAANLGLLSPERASQLSPSNRGGGDGATGEARDPPSPTRAMDQDERVTGEYTANLLRKFVPQAMKANRVLTLVTTSADSIKTAVNTTMAKEVETALPQILEAVNLRMPDLTLRGVEWPQVSLMVAGLAAPYQLQWIKAQSQWGVGRDVIYAIVGAFAVGFDWHLGCTTIFFGATFNAIKYWTIIDTLVLTYRMSVRAAVVSTVDKTLAELDEGQAPRVAHLGDPEKEFEVVANYYLGLGSRALFRLDSVTESKAYISLESFDVFDFFWGVYGLVLAFKNSNCTARLMLLNLQARSFLFVLFGLYHFNKFLWRMFMIAIKKNPEKFYTILRDRAAKIDQALNTNVPVATIILRAFLLRKKLDATAMDPLLLRAEKREAAVRIQKLKGDLTKEQELFEEVSGRLRELEHHADQHVMREDADGIPYVVGVYYEEDEDPGFMAGGYADREAQAAYERHFENRVVPQAATAYAVVSEQRRLEAEQAERGETPEFNYHDAESYQAYRNAQQVYQNAAEMFRRASGGFDSSNPFAAFNQSMRASDVLGNRSMTRGSPSTSRDMQRGIAQIQAARGEAPTSEEDEYEKEPVHVTKEPVPINERRSVDFNSEPSVQVVEQQLHAGQEQPAVVLEQKAVTQEQQPVVQQEPNIVEEPASVEPAAVEPAASEQASADEQPALEAQTPSQEQKRGFVGGLVGSKESPRPKQSPQEQLQGAHLSPELIVTNQEQVQPAEQPAVEATAEKTETVAEQPPAQAAVTEVQAATEVQAVQAGATTQATQEATIADVEQTQPDSNAQAEQQQAGTATAEQRAARASQQEEENGTEEQWKEFNNKGEAEKEVEKASGRAEKDSKDEESKGKKKKAKKHEAPAPTDVNWDKPPDNIDLEFLGNFGESIPYDQNEVDKALEAQKKENKKTPPKSQADGLMAAAGGLPPEAVGGLLGARVPSPESRADEEDEEELEEEYIHEDMKDVKMVKRTSVAKKLAKQRKEQSKKQGNIFDDADGKDDGNRALSPAELLAKAENLKIKQGLDEYKAEAALKRKTEAAGRKSEFPLLGRKTNIWNKPKVLSEASSSVRFRDSVRDGDRDEWQPDSGKDRAISKDKTGSDEDDRVPSEKKGHKKGKKKKAGGGLFAGYLSAAQEAAESTFGTTSTKLHGKKK